MRLNIKFDASLIAIGKRADNAALATRHLRTCVTDGGGCCADGGLDWDMAAGVSLRCIWASEIKTFA